MKKNEPKRDERGRFVSKSKLANTKIEPMNGSMDEYITLDYLDVCMELQSAKAELAYVKTERDEALKKVKELESYERHWNKLLQTAKLWRERAIGRKAYAAFLLEIIEALANQIMWYRHHMSFFTKLLYREDLRSMSNQVDGFIKKAEKIQEEE